MASPVSYQADEDPISAMEVYPFMSQHGSVLNPYSYDYSDTNGTEYEMMQAYTVSIGAKVILILSYTLMIVICGTGNFLLCCVIYRFKRMRTVTNLLIGNLALSDFLVAAVVAPFNFYYYIHQTWPFGKAMCVIVGFLKAVSLYVSVNSLLTIAIDRYLTIMNPLRPRMTHSTTMTILGFIWVVSSAVVIPSTINTETHVDTKPDGRQVIQCVETGWKRNSALLANTLFLVIGEFCIPLTLMSVIYFLIARRLWFRQVPCDHMTEQQEAAAEASKRRTIRMLIIVVALFAICWAPYNGFSIARDFYLPSSEDSKYKLFNTMFYLVEALAMLNSMFNTLIYIFFNVNFRKCVFQLFTPANRTCTSQSTVRVRYSRPSQVAKGSSNNYDACNHGNGRGDLTQDTARTSVYQT
ncbi:prokineticin receptor 1-like [Diadema setosum]|uniref:prokineticin receptor 1-like n=1 Tax=Diadema setosum TaxID=31175 RepID=UPI003B3A20DE